MDIFDRYRECKEVVVGIKDETQRKHAESILSQLLHIEQARGIAERSHQKYREEMNGWENNLVKSICQTAREAELSEKGDGENV